MGATSDTRVCVVTGPVQVIASVTPHCSGKELLVDGEFVEPSVDRWLDSGGVA